MGLNQCVMKYSKQVLNVTVNCYVSIFKATYGAIYSSEYVVFRNSFKTITTTATTTTRIASCTNYKNKNNKCNKINKKQ